MNKDHKAINVLIVDDEKKACTNLVNILKEFIASDIVVSGIAYSTQEAESFINKMTPDAIFLDIEMPNENAFQFLERIAPFDFEVIFVTAFDEYAIRAFKLNALDYILKPISINELRNAVEKLKEKMMYKGIVRQKNVSYIELSEQVVNKVNLHKITLRDGSGTEIVDFSDILFVEAQSSYSRILFNKDNAVKEITMSCPLSDYEELLPQDHFFRIHRSYLINCRHLKKITNDNANQVIISNQFALPVSRRRYLSLIDFLKNNDQHYA